MAKTNAIEVKNLVKTYGNVYALKNVDLNIADGEYFVLLGPSGGGKTTLLRSIGGFIRPDSGSVNIKGQNVDKFINILALNINRTTIRSYKTSDRS